ncbi:hypothetical protein FKM82_001195 [Ascaphus truei]
MLGSPCLSPSDLHHRSLRLLRTHLKDYGCSFLLIFCSFEGITPVFLLSHCLPRGKAVLCGHHLRASPNHYILIFVFFKTAAQTPTVV